MLRRVHKHQLTPVSRFYFGDVVVDFSQARVSKRGQPVNLTAKEPKLLQLFLLGQEVITISSTDPFMPPLSLRWAAENAQARQGQVQSQYRTT